jgi:uncharacterized membrane protein
LNNYDQKDIGQEVIGADAQIIPPQSTEAKIEGIAKPVVLTEVGRASQPLLTPSVPSSAKRQQSEVTVAPNLTDLVAGRVETPEDQKAVSQQRNLNEVVHGVLLVGLAISTILMLLGLGLDLIWHRDVPTAVPGFGEVFRRVAELRPSGFLVLGLLVLIATPIMRVVGSIFAFLYERDWRYAAITFLVLVVVSLSLFLGQG